MFQDPRRLSFLLLPAIIAVSGVVALISGAGSVNLDSALVQEAPNLPYVDESEPSDDASGPLESEEALPALTIPLAPTTTGPPPSTGEAAPGLTAPHPGSPTTQSSDPGTPISAPGTSGAPATNPSPAPTTGGAPSTSGPAPTTTPKVPATTAPPSPTPTTKAPGTAPPTSPIPTTAAPTTSPPTTAAPTTRAPTTAAPTTAPPTTAPPTTQPPQTNPGAEPIIGVLIEGESTSDPNGGWVNYPEDVATNLGPSVSVKVDGQNGVRADQINAEGSKAHLLTGGTGQNVAVLWIGINDISQARQPSDVYSQISTWTSNRRNEGWDRVVILTVTKFEHPNSLMSFSWGSHEIADQKRQELNNLIVANGAGADAIVDMRNKEGIGDSYSVYDTNWRPDKVHLSHLGNERVAGYVSDTIRSLGS